MKTVPSIVLAGFLLAGGDGFAERGATPPAKPAAPAAETPAQKTAKLVAAAKAQVGVTTGYDPAYVRIPYPNGDVPPGTGVCADVVVRAFRAAGLDLQALVHEDMKANFKKYPQKWGLKKPDSNIDHRRVANLMTWFGRQGKAVRAAAGGNGKTEERKKAGGEDLRPESFRPGDVVAWDLNGNGLLHIGVVADAKSADGRRFLVVHNIGRGAQMEDVLASWSVIGHYRPFP